LPAINYWLLLYTRWTTPDNYWDEYWDSYFNENSIEQIQLGGPSYHPEAAV